MEEEAKENQSVRPMSRPHRRRTSSTFSRLAVPLLAAIALIIIGLLIFVPSPEERNPSSDKGVAGGSGENRGLQAQVGTGASADAIKDTASDYRPFLALEALIGTKGRQPKFTVLSPDETVQKGTLIVFRWADDQQGPWKVTILDNRGIALKEEDVKDREYTLSSPKPGLYYWTVAREDKLLHIGRVAVR